MNLTNRYVIRCYSVQPLNVLLASSIVPPVEPIPIMSYIRCFTISINFGSRLESHDDHSILPSVYPSYSCGLIAFSEGRPGLDHAQHQLRDAIHPLYPANGGETPSSVSSYRLNKRS